MYKSLENTIRRTKSEEEWLRKLKKRKQYNVLDSDGNSPLTISAYYGHLDGCKYIMHNGGHLDFANNDGETPLKCAIGSFGSQGNVHQISEVIHFLIKNKANINKADKEKVSCLMEALRYERCSDIAITLIKKGADVDFCNKWKMTPLMYAANIKNNDVYQELIDAGADINAIDEIGRNPLYFVAAKGTVSGFGNWEEIIENDKKILN